MKPVPEKTAAIEAGLAAVTADPVTNGNCSLFKKTVFGPSFFGPIIDCQAWYNALIDNKLPSIESLVKGFLKRGGHINKLYLKDIKRSPILVHLNGWYRGRNLREAITRALKDQ